MKNIFLVASPLQILCSYEFSKKFAAKNNLICPIYIKGAHLRNKQIKNTIETFGFKNVKNINVEFTNFLQLKIISTLIKFFLLRKFIGKENYRLVLGDFRDKTMHISFVRIIIVYLRVD